VYHKRTRSHVDNAAQHRGYHPVAKTDISGFYPSTTKQMIKAMFVEQFGSAKDVAGILADICCYQSKHLPTGSAISGYIAFFASKNLFDRVNELAKLNNCTFTLYVDDLTLSGDAASKALINEVRSIIKQEGHSSKIEKTHTFPPHAAKTITGVIVKGNQCLLPNAQYKAIDDTRKAIKFASSEGDKRKLSRSLKGRLLAAKQVHDVNDKFDEYPVLIYS
jgi:hypothetical protein